MAKRTYRTDQIVVYWDSERCVHSGICLGTLPAVFDVERRPWVTVDGAGSDEIAAAVAKCPSGALHFERLDGAPQEEPAPYTTVFPSPDGPLYVRGDVVVIDRSGEVVRRDSRVALCRCGASNNQPFCDMSHRDIGFRDKPPEISEHRGQAESPPGVAPES